MVDPVYEAIANPFNTFNYTTEANPAYEAVTEANPAYAAANLASNSAVTEVNPDASETVKSLYHEYEDVKLHSNSEVGILHHDAYQFTACCAYGKTVN